MKSFGPGRMTSDNPNLKAWREVVGYSALIASRGHDLPTNWGMCPIHVQADFYFARPAKMPKGRTSMTTKPDIDKLIRGILDSLSNVLFKDDAQVVEVTSVKRYGMPERAEISVHYLESVLQ